MAKILAIGGLNTSTGTEKLVALKDRHFFTLVGSTWTKASGAGINLTDQTRAYHDEFLDMQFWVNGVDANRTYNGSTWSTTTNVTDSPIGKYVKSFGTRLYLANIIIAAGASNLAFKSRVWFSNLPQQDSSGNWTISWGLESGSDMGSTAASAVVTSAGSSFKSRGLKVGDPLYIISGNNAKKYTISSIDSETQLTLTENVTNTTSNQTFWAGGNWFDVKTDDSDVITGLGENAGRLLVFKQDSLHRWDGASLEQIKQVPGTTAQNSVVNLRGFTFYFHPSGIWRYNGQTSELISEPVWDLVEAIDSTNYGEVVGWTDNAHFIKLYVGTTSANLNTDLPAITHCVIVYDLTMNSYSTMSLGTGISAACNATESAVKKIFAGATDGNVYQLETGNDFDGSAIPFRLRTHPYYPISPEAVVELSRIEIFAQRGENLNVGYKKIKQPYPDDQEYFPISDDFPNDDLEMRGIKFEMIESSTDQSFLFEKLSVFWSGGRLDK